MRRKHWIEKAIDENREKIIREVDFRIERMIKEELQRREQDYFMDNDLVIIVKDNQTCVYDHGKKITNATSIDFQHRFGDLPTIEYEKYVSKN